MTTSLDDYSDNSTTNGILTIGGRATGRFDFSYDTDWFAVQLEAGTNYLFGGSQGISLSLLGPGLELWQYSVHAVPLDKGAVQVSYRAQVTGTYFLSVANQSSVSPGYAVTAASIQQDDYSARSNTAGKLPLGVSTFGTFESNSDVDDFVFSAQAGGLYRMTLVENLLDERVADHRVKVDVEGNLDGRVSGSGKTHTVNFTAPVSGASHISVGASSDTGTYVIRVDALADDFLASAGTTGRVAPGLAASGTINAENDVDWFKIHMGAGTSYSLAPAASGNGSSYSISLVDAAGKEVSRPDPSGSSSGLTYTATVEGDYFLAVKSSYGYLTNYAIEAKLLADDIPALASAFPLLALAAPANGTIDFRGDTDSFRFKAVAGTYYTMQLKPEAGLPSNTIAMAMTDQNGSAVQDFLSLGAGRYAYLSEKTGEFQLVLSAGGVAKASYALEVVSAVADAVPGKPGGGPMIAVNATVQGQMDYASDIDNYRVHLETGGTYRFSASGAGLRNYAVALTDSYGVVTFEGSDTFIAPVAGDYDVTLYAAGTGAYQFDLLRVPDYDSISANPGTTGKLVTGIAVDGSLDRLGDSDWYAVTLQAGSSYNIAAKFATLAQFHSLAVFDATGKLLKPLIKTQQSSTENLPFTADYSGVHYIALGGGKAGGEHYTVTLQTVDADDHGNDIQHGTVLKPGASASGRLDSGNDTDAFQVHLAAGESVLLKATQMADGVPYSLYISAPQSLSNPGLFLSGAGGLYTAFAEGNYGFTLNRGNAGIGSDYQLTMSRPLGDDYPDKPEQAAKIGIGGYAGMLSPKSTSDQDCFKIYLEQGKVYDLDLHTLDPFGTAIASIVGLDNVWTSANAVADGKLTFMAFSSGDYVIKIDGGVRLLDNAYYFSITNANLDFSAPVLAGVQMASARAAQGDIVLTFNEAIIQGVGKVRVIDDIGQVVANFETGDQRASIDHDTLTLDMHAKLYPGVQYTVELGQGRVADLSGNLLAASSIGIKLAATGLATGGNDLLTASGRGDLIDGGAGVDTAFYRGAASDFHILRSAGGAEVGVAGSATADKLVGVERLLFTDGAAMAIDIDGTGGAAYRLYQAAFNRVPDKSGIGFWMAKMDQGMALKAVAHDFIISPEFVATYGQDLSNSAFLDQLYHNVLHRTGDADGFAWWLNALDHGAERAEVLKEFSESPENKALTIDVIANGFEFTPYLG